ncbi:Uncharacterised protein [uncultured archaeon]|nr:Uncharacterised protein [uncultured archaeon]
MLSDPSTLHTLLHPSITSLSSGWQIVSSNAVLMASITRELKLYFSRARIVSSNPNRIYICFAPVYGNPGKRAYSLAVKAHLIYRS